MYKNVKLIFGIVFLCLLGSLFLFIMINCKADADEVISESQNSEFNGTWEIKNFEGVSVQYGDISEEEIKNETSKYIGKKLVISKDTITKVSPPCEWGYEYDTVDDLFFGYKPPSNITFAGKIHYEVLKHNDFDTEIRLMTDGINNAYLDIGGFFYRIEKQI